MVRFALLIFISGTRDKELSFYLWSLLSCGLCAWQGWFTASVSGWTHALCHYGEQLFLWCPLAFRLGALFVFFFFSLNCQNLAWFGYARVQSYSVLFFFWDSDGCCSFVLCFPAMWLTLASCNQMHQLQSIDS